jgi:hypothetical protein
MRGFSSDAPRTLANEDITQLNELWRTELHSPEILPFQQHLFNNIRELLQHQQVDMLETVSC